MISIRTLLAATTLLIFSTALPAGEAMRVSDAWIPQPPPGTRTLAAYFDLENTTPETIHVVAAASADFERVEIHRTELADGIARMRRVERVPVGPAETVRFQQGGLHLMLIEPRRKLAEGDSVTLELIRDEGTPIRFTAGIRPRNEAEIP